MTWRGSQEGKGRMRENRKFKVRRSRKGKVGERDRVTDEEKGMELLNGHRNYVSHNCKRGWRGADQQEGEPWSRREQSRGWEKVSKPREGECWGKA